MFIVSQVLFFFDNDLMQFLALALRQSPFSLREFFETRRGYDAVG